MGLLGQKMGMMAAVAVAMMAAVAVGQQECVSKLVPCYSYLNATNPPSSCCTPLKEAVTTELSCLCAIYKEPNLLTAFNITVEGALQLAQRCGVTTNLTACNIGAPAPGSNPPPATPGGGNGSGSAHSATWFGISGLVSLFFFWWSILA